MTGESSIAHENGSRLDMLAPLEIGLCVADLDAMADFYEKVVGLIRIGEVDLGGDTARRAGFNEAGFRMVRMQTPYGERIKLLAPLDGGRADAQPRFMLGRTGIAYLTFIVSDLRAKLGDLAGAGVELLSGLEPIQTRPGTEIAFACDIEGNALEFVQYGDIRAYRPDLFDK